MREPAWMTKYQAREALKNGRPEEAHRMLEGLIASGDRKVWALRADVVRGYVERAERSLRNDDVESAWNDLNIGSSVGAPNDPAVNRLRETLVRLAVAEVRAMLEAGKPLQAMEAITRLKERPAASPALVSLEEAARDWQNAVDLSDRGEFAQARTALASVRPKLGSRTMGIDRFEESLNLRDGRFTTAWPQLQEMLVAGDWRQVLRCADEVLQAAPRHREAQQSRNRAWQMVQPQSIKPTPTLSETMAVPRPMPTEESAAPAQPLKRFFLWIDGIGAFLVCLAPRVSFGQATADGPVDVPLFADVSRIHAALTREDECYLLEAGKSVSLNSASIDRAVLQSGDVLTLGKSCRLAFDLPVPGSLSSRLMLAGGRRLPMAVDGVLLMADMLILGGNGPAHVSLPDLEKPLYIVRNRDGLAVTWDGEFHVDGVRHAQRAPLPRQGSVTSEHFSFAVEPVK